MSQRKPTVRRPQGQRAKHGVLGLFRLLLVLALCVEVLAALWRSPALCIRDVYVEGIALTSPQQIVQGALIADGRSWLFFMPARVAERIQQLPTVADVVVARSLPGRVTIRVFERQPVALLATPEGSYWLDAQGVAFWKTERANGLPVIRLETRVPVVLGRVVGNRSVQAGLEILVRYLPEYPLPIAQITVDREGNLCLNMKDGHPPVRIGDSTSLSEKMMRTAQLWMYPEIVKQAEYLDVSCVEKPVWKRRQGSKEGIL